MAYRSIRNLGLLLVAAFATAAVAQPAPSDPNVVSGVAVVSSDPPKVTATWPASGAAIAPGVLVLKIVFDQPMTADQWSYAKAVASDYPDCLPTPRLLADRKTFALLCSTTTGKRYGVQINATDARGFVNVGDRRAPLFDLGFTTSNAEPIRTLKAAMKLAGLGELDMPVESLGSFISPATGVAPNR